MWVGIIAAAAAATTAAAVVVVVFNAIRQNYFLNLTYFVTLTSHMFSLPLYHSWNIYMNLSLALTQFIYNHFLQHGIIVTNGSDYQIIAPRSTCTENIYLIARRVSSNLMQQGKFIFYITFGKFKESAAAITYIL